MRAVNLIPSDGRGRGRASASSVMRPTYAVLGLLAVAVVLVTVYVLTSNTISERKAKLAQLQQEVVQAQAQAAQLTKYTQFAQLAQTRATTIRQIASARFDWHSAMDDLSRVIPANTSLQSLVATTSSGSGTGGAGASTGALRGAISAPAFEMKGCTSSQDDVARLISRLRLINGVTRVSLADSVKPGGSGPVSSASSAGSGCGANGPSFDLVVFFQPIPVATAPGAPALGQPISSAAAGGGAR